MNLKEQFFKNYVKKRALVFFLLEIKSATICESLGARFSRQAISKIFACKGLATIIRHNIIGVICLYLFRTSKKEN